MKGFWNRQKEETEEMQEDALEILDLDDTTDWSKLEVEAALEEQQAENLMEEIGDELAILDVIEEAAELEFLQDEDAEIQQLQDEDIEIQQLQDEDVEYLSMDEETEMLESEEDMPAFLERLAMWFSGWTAMDKMIAVTGVVVFLVAVFTIGAYAGHRGLNKQVEAFAEVGEQLETIGITGTDKLLAVADAKKAMLEAAKLEAELSQEYEENELSAQVQVVMKMTSVQKDLKIKFVNKKTGKLVGNIPFEVKITDADNKTYNKIDEDKDGIIYLTNLTPGSYSVAMVELAGVDQEEYSFSTAAEKIKVKESIAYEKIDVSDEIKDQSQVNVSTEDTAQKTETEGSLADTVEWVESTVTKKDGTGSEKYTPVDKSTIQDPGLSSSLKLDISIVKIMQESILASQEGIRVLTSEGETEQPASPADPVTPSSPEQGNEEPSAPEEGGDNAVTPTVSITSAAVIELEVGQTAVITAAKTPDSAVLSFASANGAVATADAAGTVTAAGAGETTITVTAAAGEKSATATVTVKVTKKNTAAAVTEVKLDKTEVTLKVGETATLQATVMPDNAADKTVTFRSDDSAVAAVDGSGTITAVKEGTTTITAAAGGKTASCKVTVTAASVSVTGVALDKTTVALKTGGTDTLKAVVSPAEASNTKVTWSSSDTNIASVDSNGKITAVKEGTAVITVKTEDGGKTATCTVTVSKAYDAKTDTSTALKDKSGNQIYVLVNGNYVEAKVADYYKYSTFYKKETVSEYTYTGWQNLDGKTYYFDKNGNKVTGEQVIQGAKYSFNSDGSLNTGSGILGIDVSTWNGNIDWTKVKNSGVSYVIIRTGFRGSTQGALVEDNKFRQNIQGAINAGLKVGVYFFSQAINEVEAVEEASMVLSQIKGYKISYPVFIDVEPSGGRADGLSSGDRTKVINAFCQTIQNGGYRAGIYANKTWLNQKMNISALSGYKIWLAQYNSTVTYGGRYDMWQYSSKGSVSGISGNVDMNLSYMSY